MRKSVEAAGAKGKAGAHGVVGIPGTEPRFPERDIPRYDDAKFRGHLEIDALVCEIIELNRRKAEIADTVAGLSAQVQAMMEEIDDAGSWSVKDDDWTVSYIKSEPTRKLVPEKLVANGVSLSIIEKSYVLVPRKPYVQVRGRRGAGGGDE